MSDIRLRPSQEAVISYPGGKMGVAAVPGASVRQRTPLAPEVWPRRLAKSEGKMLRGAFRHCGVITAIASLL